MAREKTVGSIVDQEGLTQWTYPIGIDKRENLIQNSIDLFDFILEDGDQRWDIVRQWAMVRNDRRIEGVHREVALRAVYLSEHPSWRDQLNQWVNEENLRQLCRAGNNLLAGEILEKAFSPPKIEGWELRLKRTNMVNLGTDKDRVTACPEALYQLQLFRQKGDRRWSYVGRTGFNLHKEGGVWVTSITNIQGTPDGCISLDRFSDETGEDCFGFLVNQTINLARCFDQTCVIRAWKNSFNGNRELMNTVCKRAGIKRVSFRREQLIV